MRSVTVSPAAERDLDPGGATLSVCRALDRLVPDGPIGVAVSGGGDSAALLVIAAEWAAARGRRIASATVDHNLRASSRQEADAAGELAAGLGLSHTVLSWHGSAQGNLQAEARAARQRLLSGWARDLGLAAVLTAHTRDDQAETVLMRLARGSGADGLAGIPESRRLMGTLWLRPCLDVSRAALRGVLEARSLPWSEDPSNADTRFDRVKMRQALAILHPLGVTHAGLAETASRLAAQSLVLDDAMRRLSGLARIWGRLGDARLDLGALGSARDDTAHRLLADTLQRIGGSSHRPRQRALEGLMTRAGLGESGTLAGCQFRVAAGQLSIWRERAAAEGKIAAGPEGVWDRRWHLRLFGSWPRAEIGALSDAGRLQLRRAAKDGWSAPRHHLSAPAALLCVQPGIWAGPTLLAAPSLAYISEDVAQAGCSASLTDLAAPHVNPDRSGIWAQTCRGPGAAPH